MVKLAYTSQKLGGVGSTPSITRKDVAPVPSNDTESSWDPDPQGLTMYELWDAYLESVNAVHAEWVREDPTRKSGYIYAFAMMGASFHRSDATQVMKIGMSRDPDTRLKQVRKSNVKMPYTIEPWFKFWTSDMRRAERLLHMMLQRYRMDGEWFAIPQALWESLHSLWYIDTYHSNEDLEFRDKFTGAWFTPHDFFEYHVNMFHEQFARFDERSESEESS